MLRGKLRIIMKGRLATGSSRLFQRLRTRQWTNLSPSRTLCQLQTLFQALFFFTYLHFFQHSEQIIGLENKTTHDRSAISSRVRFKSRDSHATKRSQIQRMWSQDSLTFAVSQLVVRPCMQPEVLFWIFVVTLSCFVHCVAAIHVRYAEENRHRDWRTTCWRENRLTPIYLSLGQWFPTWGPLIPDGSWSIFGGIACRYFMCTAVLPLLYSSFRFWGSFGYSGLLQWAAVQNWLESTALA